MKDLEMLFAPRSIAVVGASQDLSSISGQPIKHLLEHGYTGRVFPVNPRYDSVAGRRCYPDLLSLPEVPDVVVIAVAAKRVLSVVQQMGERGIPFGVILSSGFAEVGDEGRRVQKDLIELANKHDIGLIGPNCTGYMSFAEGVRAGFGVPYAREYRLGAVSLVSQSGAFGASILMMADGEGLGFRRYVSTGNEAVLTSLDLFKHFLADKKTSLIAAYVEGFKDAKRLVALGREALRIRKPILAWKVGRSDAGAKAAASHTANLGGSAALYRAAFKQAGIVEVHDTGDLADCAKALLPGRLPAQNRIAIVTMSGGAGIAMADTCTESGLELPELAPETVESLREILPPYAALANPLDVTGNLINNPDMWRETLAQVARDPSVDMIGLALAAISGKMAADLAAQIVEISDATGLPILVAWNADESAASEAYRIVDEGRIPRYQSPVRLARGAGALVIYARAVKRLAESDSEEGSWARPSSAKTALKALRGDLTEYQSKEVLAEYGIPATKEHLVRSRDEACAVAGYFDGPVVMKIQSPDIPHKTEAGGVEVGVEPASAGKAYDRIMSSAAAHATPDRIDGVLVQELIQDAIELIAGVVHDPQFGPAVMVGFGGIYAEVFRDVAFRIAPITRTEALEMIRELQAFPILDGARGRAKADVEAVADVLLGLSAAAVDSDTEALEIDINPLFVLPAGSGAVAGDALIRRG